MYARNKWNKNKKFSLPILAQDVLNSPQNNIKTSCCIDTTKTSCQSNVKTSCCIDTTKVINGPCSSEITTSCCIDTTKE